MMLTGQEICSIILPGMSLNKRYVLGADPGKHGAIVLLSETYDPVRITADDIVMFPVRASNGKLDVVQIWNFLYPYRNNILLYMQEDVHALFGSSAKGTFEFGDANGALRAVFQLLIASSESKRAALECVTPRDWQKKVWKPENVVYKDDVDKLGRKKKDTKATSLNASSDLFPGVSFVPKRAKLPHDGLVDAALIAYYALTALKSCQ